MILQQLFTDFDTIMGDAKPPPMYDYQAVKWIVDVTKEGEYNGITPLGDKYGTPQLLPYNYGRSSDVVPSLLADTADYALGPSAAPDDKNAGKKHVAFRELLAKCADAVQNSLVNAIVKFLDAGGVSSEEVKKHGIKPKERVAFTVGGEWPTDTPKVREFWDKLTAHECKGKIKQEGVCLVTGRQGFVESVLPCDIRIAGESAPIVSVNDPAANSYGFEQSYNGAVSRDAAEGFTKALNALMHGEHSHFRLTLNRDGSDEMVYVFWAKQSGEDDVFAAITSPDPQVVQKVFLSTSSGERVYDSAFDANQFFAVAITGNKTRVVFRDWLATTLPEVMQRLRQWFLAQKLTDFNGDTKYFGVKQLAGALYRRDSKGKLLEKITPRVLRALLRAALHGEPIPRELLSRAVLRCRAEHYVSLPRVVLMKTALTLNNEQEAQKMAELDPDSTDPPYVCGRLLALLESIQYQAQGNVNSNIIDRYFSAAATTPGRILPLLIKKAETAHLPKIRRQNKGSFFNLSSDLTQMIDRLPASYHSSTLTLEEQMRFMLGFYHQKAYTSARIQEAKDKKNAKQTDGENTANNTKTQEANANV